MEEATGEHQKFTPRQRKEQTLRRVDEVAKWIVGLREQAEGGGITWEQFDNLVARAMVARERYAAWMRKHSLIDRLTGVPNRRWIETELGREIEEARRSGDGLGFLMMDIDDFKKMNDKYGHPKGDKILKAIAELFQKNVRAADFSGRWGGEEFAAIIVDPRIDSEESSLEAVAERLRTEVQKIFSRREPRITISVGGAYFRSEENMPTLIMRVDKALYRSKRAGKNRTTVG